MAGSIDGILLQGNHDTSVLNFFFEERDLENQIQRKDFL